MRNKIKMFAQQKVTLPPGRQKIVILDEADSMTSGAQQVGHGRHGGAGWGKAAGGEWEGSAVAARRSSFARCLREQADRRTAVVAAGAARPLTLPEGASPGPTPPATPHLHCAHAPSGPAAHDGAVQRHHALCASLQPVQQDYRADPEPLRHRAVSWAVPASRHGRWLGGVMWGGQWEVGVG